ncbi:MAG: hypothetical protein AAGL49_04735 [Pseudomonadota bacterium]
MGGAVAVVGEGHLQLRAAGDEAAGLTMAAAARELQIDRRILHIAGDAHPVHV